MIQRALKATDAQGHIFKPPNPIGSPTNKQDHTGHIFNFEQICRPSLMLWAFSASLYPFSQGRILQRRAQWCKVTLSSKKDAGALPQGRERACETVPRKRAAEAGEKLPSTWKQSADPVGSGRPGPCCGPLSGERLSCSLRAWAGLSATDSPGQRPSTLYRTRPQSDRLLRGGQTELGHPGPFGSLHQLSATTQRAGRGNPSQQPCSQVSRKGTGGIPFTSRKRMERSR